MVEIFFWRKVTDIFEPIWMDSADGELSDRVDYLKKALQDDKYVLFQAIFLKALVRLCFAMGGRRNGMRNPHCS